MLTATLDDHLAGIDPEQEPRPSVLSYLFNETHYCV